MVYGGNGTSGVAGIMGVVGGGLTGTAGGVVGPGKPPGIGGSPLGGGLSSGLWFGACSFFNAWYSFIFAFVQSPTCPKCSSQGTLHWPVHK